MAHQQQHHNMAVAVELGLLEVLIILVVVVVVQHQKGRHLPEEWALQD
jgi:Flp pilus assembly pilin Flp